MTMFVLEALFHKLGGSEGAGSGFAAIHSPVLHTPHGTPYLARPGVIVLARPRVNLEGLGGFDDALHFPAYLETPHPCQMTQGDRIGRIFSGCQDLI